MKQFWAWLMGLFGAKPSVTTPVESSQPTVPAIPVADSPKQGTSVVLPVLQVSGIPQKGDKGPDVLALQKNLNLSGANPKLTEDGSFGDKTAQAISVFQKSKGLAGSGILGEQTMSLLNLKIVAPAVPSAPASGEYFGAPWVGANIDLLGRYETDKELNARYVPEWALEGLPSYKTLSGNSYAWCSLRANADRRKVGVKGTNSAAAASWSSWGKKCPFWFGAALDIKHASGGRHVCEFLYWIDEKKKIAATLDGNRSNQFAVFQTDLSGKGDTLVAGPRWSSSWPDGQSVTQAQVLAKYPFLKVGGTGSATR